MWDLPGPGLKPVSPALAGGFLTTVPPGKSSYGFLNFRDLNLCAFYITLEFIGLEKTCFHHSGSFGTFSNLHFYHSLKVYERCK